MADQDKPDAKPASPEATTPPAYGRNETHRRAILARRAQLLSLALAGAGVLTAGAGCDWAKDEPKPPPVRSVVCLSIARPADAGPTVSALPTTGASSAEPTTTESAADPAASGSAKKDAGAAPPPRPSVCLTPATPPRPCLGRPPMKDGKSG